MYLFNNFSYWIPGVQIPTYLEITIYSSMLRDDKSKGGRPTHSCAPKRRDADPGSRIPFLINLGSRIQQQQQKGGGDIISCLQFHKFHQI